MKKNKTDSGFKYSKSKVILLTILFLIVPLYKVLYSTEMDDRTKKKLSSYLKYGQSAQSRLDYRSSIYFYEKSLSLCDTSYLAWKGLLRAIPEKPEIHYKRMNELLGKYQNEDINILVISFYTNIAFNRFQEADHFQEKILKHNYNFIYQIISILLETNHPELALTEVEKLPKTEKDKPEYFKILAEINFENNNFSKAVKDHYNFFKAITTKSDLNKDLITIEYFKTLTEIIKCVEFTENSEKELKKILDFFKESNDYYSLLFASEIEFRLKRFNTSYETLKRASELTTQIDIKPYRLIELKFAEKLFENNHYQDALNFYNLVFKHKTPEENQIGEYINYLKCGLLTSHNKEHFKDLANKLFQSGYNFDLSNQYKFAMLFKNCIKDFNKTRSILLNTISMTGEEGINSLKYLGEIKLMKNPDNQDDLNEIFLRLKEKKNLRSRNNEEVNSAIYYLKMLKYLNQDSLKTFIANVESGIRKRWHLSSEETNILLKTAEYLKECQGDKHLEKLVLENFSQSLGYSENIIFSDFEDLDSLSDSKKRIVMKIKYNYLKAGQESNKLFDFIFSLDAEQETLLFLDFCRDVSNGKITPDKNQKIQLKEKILNLLMTVKTNMFTDNLRTIYRRI